MNIQLKKIVTISKINLYFIELPCKIGDTIYDISEFLLSQYYSPEIYVEQATWISISKDDSGYVFDINGNDYHYEDFGKTVFLTREEAESKLKEMEREQE